MTSSDPAAQPPNYPKGYNRVGAEYTTFCGIPARSAGGGGGGGAVAGWRGGGGAGWGWAAKRVGGGVRLRQRFFGVPRTRGDEASTEIAS
jgi:hypothetical protein